jgi:membrane protein required for colicin V production
MPVTVLDVIVIVVVLISAILAMIRGFVREVLSVASWVAAAAAAYLLYKSLLPTVEQYIDNHNVAIIVSAAAIFFVTLIVASYITMKISDFVIDSRIGAVDRAFGFVFGAVRGVLLLVVSLLFFNWLVPQPPGWVANARTKPFLDDLGQRLMAALPPDAEATLLGKLRGHLGSGSDEATAPGDAAGDTGAPDALGSDAAGDAPAYGDNQRGSIDQLIQNTGPSGN